MAKKNRFRDAFRRANAAFKAQYKKELAQLKGLSEEDIAAITPGIEGQEAYSSLVSIVEKAAKENTAKAELYTNIKATGGMTVSLAKKFLPGFV